MTPGQISLSLSEVKSLLEGQTDIFKPLLQEMVQQILDAQMDEALNAGRYERSGERRGYRSGSYPRTLLTRVGKLELRMPQDREGRFSTDLFARYQRSEQALVSALLEMYIQGVSTRKVKQITEELCGTEVSAATVSRINKALDEKLGKFASRPLLEDYPYLILDARYERVRQDGVITKQAVLVALGVGHDGRRQVLAVELAQRESASSWKQFLLKLRERGLMGVKYVASDDHAGLKQAIFEVLPEASWQRCYVHFLRNAKDYLPVKADPDCMQELRWMYDRRELKEARSDLALWLRKWEKRYGKLCSWVEENIEETWNFYQLPQHHRKHLKSTNVLERLNQEIKRRTLVVRIFPNEESCLRLVRALAVEIHESWMEGPRYLNMDLLRDHKKEVLRRDDQAA
jgi:putative transposase